MSKVFSLSLVLLLVVVVLFCAIPLQQSANAYTNDDTNIMQYQFFDITAKTAFNNIPYRDNYGFSIQFDVNSDFIPFNDCNIYLDDIETFLITCKYSNGVLYLTSPTDELDMAIQYNTLAPFRLEILFTPTYNSNFRVHIKINDEYIGRYHKALSFYYDTWGVFFTDGNYYGEPYPYSYWEDPESFNLSVMYKTIPATSVSIYERSWVDGASGYDTGYIDGVNAKNTATASIFPSFIGSILAFFMQIASYEVLGISLLKVGIIIGSIVLLLALLRIFVK